MDTPCGAGPASCCTRLRSPDCSLKPGQKARGGVFGSPGRLLPATIQPQVIRSSLARIVQSALASLAEEGALASLPEGAVEVEEPKQPEHGHYGSSCCLKLAKPLGMNPRQLAGLLAERLQGRPELDKVEIAGPGFINFWLNAEWAMGHAEAAAGCEGSSVLADSSHFARPAAPAAPIGINVEFVSVNPNGPITIGSGRGAAFGSALCSVLQAAGHQVHREYYINDGVNSEQMRLFAESAKALALGRPVPEKGYKGDYVQDVALKVKELFATSFKGFHPEDSAAGQRLVAAVDRLAALAAGGSVEQALEACDLMDLKLVCETLMLRAQKDALLAFGVRFDTWFSEQSLHEGGQVAECVAGLKSTGVADEEEHRTKVVRRKDKATGKVVVEETREPQGAAAGSDGDEDSDDSAGAGRTLWLRSTKFGDDMDRVLLRRDGRPTYITSDVAYHKDKYNRPPGAHKLITVLGPDHHGYIGRLTAVIAALLRTEGMSDDEALDLARQRLEVVIFQLVRFMKDGQPAPMRKRDGNIYALLDLVEELGAKIRPEGSPEEQRRAGADVARFFYLMRHHDTTFDFDLDRAQKQSDENPVFYVQYAHARICSVIDKAAESGVAGEFRPELLADPREMSLLLKTLDLANEVERTAKDYAVNRIATYAIELARTYHLFYDGCRVIDLGQPALSASRVVLCRAARAALRAALELLGVSAPERMERAAEPASV